MEVVVVEEIRPPRLRYQPRLGLPLQLRADTVHVVSVPVSLDVVGVPLELVGVPL